MIGERNYVTFYDRSKRNKFIKMKMVAATAEQNVEDHVSDIMDDMLETKTKLVSKRKYVAEKYFICMSDLKIEEGKIYENCQVGKKTKMSYKMFQYLNHAS